MEVCIIANLEGDFSNIRANTDWDLDEPMLWGFFFTDASREKLQVALPFLEADGYRFVDLFLPDVGEGQAPCFVLHVEKEEVHTPRSLDLRNQLASGSRLSSPRARVPQSEVATELPLRREPSVA